MFGYHLSCQVWVTNRDKTYTIKLNQIKNNNNLLIAKTLSEKYEKLFPSSRTNFSHFLYH